MVAISQQEKAELVDKTTGFIPHARLQGIRLEAVDGDELTLCLPYREELVGNPQTGAIHGGALTVLLDQALGIACICSDLVPPSITPTLDLRIDHLGTTPPGMDIYATAKVYRATRKVVFIEGFAWCESRDKPVARATGSFVRMADLDLKDLLNPPSRGTQP